MCVCYLQQDSDLIPDIMIYFADIILMTIVGSTLVLALVIVTMAYVCYKR